MVSGGLGSRLWGLHTSGCQCLWVCRGSCFPLRCGGLRGRLWRPSLIISASWQLRGAVAPVMAAKPLLLAPSHPSLINRIFRNKEIKLCHGPFFFFLKDDLGNTWET